MELGRDLIASSWQPYVVGNGVVERRDAALLFRIHDTEARRYSNAQIDDYRGLPRRRLRWRPPLRLKVQARFSHPAGMLRGTAGFGFWNDPFMMTGARWPALPRVIWFFYASPPSDMQLALGVSGYGWKAATLDATRPGALALAPYAPIAVLALRFQRVHRRLWPVIQRALGIQEKLLSVDMTDWHVYVLEWLPRQTHFYVDGEIVLRNAPSPRGPLGFVMWMDNQYMVVTPQGRLGWGLLEIDGEQWMEIRQLEVTAGVP
ncbi:MAG: hypothetical protein DDG58_13525 [Ardenticatenia bacterium]|jgi:hypothetical protein|nr:MAG: hypothetical protein DDG58_13525 [Ardenticatenia bacterium]